MDNPCVSRVCYILSEGKTIGGKLAVYEISDTRCIRK